MGGLVKNSTVTTLNISKNPITHIGAAAIADALKKNSTLKSLTMGAGIPLAKFRDRNIEDLDLSSMEYNDNDIIIISSLLAVNSVIKTLNLHFNKIEDLGAQKLAECLKE